VRPENLRFAADGETAGVITIRVELVEPLGSEIYLHGRAGDRTLVARIGPDHPVRAGDTVRLAVDLRRLHFFDGGSGAALRPVLTSIAR
jgi:multiple sugar transport system ATP-binding protein